MHFRESRKHLECLLSNCGKVPKVSFIPIRYKKGKLSKKQHLFDERSQTIIELKPVNFDENCQ